MAEEKQHTMGEHQQTPPPALAQQGAQPENGSACPYAGSSRCRGAAVVRRLAVFATLTAFLAFGTAHIFHHAVRHYLHAKHGDSKFGPDHRGERPWHQGGFNQPSAIPPPTAIDSVIAMRGDDADWMIRQGFRRIALSEADERWMAEDQILGLVRRKVRFMDVTEQDLESVASIKVRKAEGLPSGPKQQSIVVPLAQNVSIPSLTAWLTELSTTFKTRYYQSTSGAKASEWIFSKVKKLSKGAADGVKVSVQQFDHSWPQSSIIARIEGEDPDAPIAVLSAHLDSINQWNPWFGQSPGADDDGSGSAMIFEAFRVLLAAGFAPKRPIEFHWYAAEEGGLLGSQKVVADYKSKGIPVIGVYHTDVAGYQPSGKAETIGVITDNVDAALVAFLKSLIDEYSDVKWTETKCGYACSDHASWTKAGFSAVITSEAEFSDTTPYIHTANDDVSHISFDHLAKFSRLAVAFAVELGLH
ncbi:hypothetical protein DFJ73DRAFT_826008 [Zopfochytrium polystomum]|nr:hypothetical protein DFJ73DRAFT_826008 [Zopfochytrium polystomum]